MGTWPLPLALRMGLPARWVRSALGLLLTLLLALGPSPTAQAAGGQRIQVTPEQDLAAVLAAARDGDEVTLAPGRYLGNFHVVSSIRLVGQPGAVLDGGGSGTVLTVSAPGVTITGVTVRGSGSSHDKEDAAITVEAPGATLRANRLEEALFGIYLKNAPKSRVEDNVIIGADVQLDSRGDGIKTWYSADAVIKHNRVDGVRDVLISFSERTTLVDNEIRNGRYGIHFMYSNDSRLEGNKLIDNFVGTYLMYSVGLVIKQNHISGGHGPSGYAIGLKDMDDVTLTDNWLVGNRVGLFVDNSPRSLDVTNKITGNAFVQNGTGIMLQQSVHNNQFTANSFLDNLEQVAIAGGKQGAENLWQGNYWSDYAGYDRNGDGVGDLPYKAISLFENLMDRHPELAYYRFSPGETAVDMAAKAFPVFAPVPKLTDDAPRMRPELPAIVYREERSKWPMPFLSLTLCVIGLLIPLLARSRRGVGRHDSGRKADQTLSRTEGS